MVYDELPPGLDLLTHEHGEELVCQQRILDRYLLHHAGIRVHGRLPQLLGIHLSQTLVPVDLGTGADLVHGCLELLVVEAVMKRFKEAGAVISFDVNFRGNLWTGEEARKCIEEILPLVDIFFCSESTAQLTFGKTGSLEDIMKSFTTEYPISVVASTQRTVHSPKVHDFGSVIYSSKNDRFYTEEPYKGIEVVDRIGSGDAYVGGVLYGLLSDPEDYLRALEFGDAASAVKNTIPGDLPSSDRNELEEVIRAHKSTGIQTEMSR